MDKKMTAREFYELVLDATRGSDAEDYMQMYDYALEAIEKLNNKNANRKPSKDAIEAGQRRDDVIGLFVDNTVSVCRDDVAENLGITAGQATSALTEWVKRGVLKKETKKVGKAQKTYYSLVA